MIFNRKDTSSPDDRGNPASSRSCYVTYHSFDIPASGMRNVILFHYHSPNALYGWGNRALLCCSTVLIAYMTYDVAFWDRKQRLEERSLVGGGGYLSSSDTVSLYLIRTNGKSHGTQHVLRPQLSEESNPETGAKMGLYATEQGILGMLPAGRRQRNENFPRHGDSLRFQQGLQHVSLSLCSRIGGTTILTLEKPHAYGVLYMYSFEKHPG